MDKIEIDSKKNSDQIIINRKTFLRSSVYILLGLLTSIRTNPVMKQKSKTNTTGYSNGTYGGK